MSLYNLLFFNSALGKQKFEYTSTLENSCPFCDRKNLKDIIAEDGSIILVKNKFQVIEDAYQTVLIETDSCDADLSTYTKEHLYKVLHFGVSHWLQMENSGKYASVLFFKNHGPLSGGSLPHAHMQIVGLNNIDYKANILPEHFLGILINRTEKVEFNISTVPRIGFSEFNVILSDIQHLEQMADYIQIAIRYLLTSFNNCKSYNLFFYYVKGIIYAKIIPRFVASPIYIGYSLPQVTDRIKNIAIDLQKKYF